MCNKFILILFIMMVIVCGVNAASVEDRRNEIISIINEEISEVSSLSNQSGGRDPDLKLRLAELYLEKARLIKETENERYLRVPPKKRRKVKKSNYFRKSTNLFNVANKVCLGIAKKHKRYRNLSDVYFILGYNAKEFNNDQQATKYLSYANRKARRGTPSKIKTQISLAEVHFNQGRYKKAIPLYESSLRKYHERWWTKESFNLAWSYYRTKKYSKAINKMLQVYTKSKNEKFVDMRKSVERDIGLFYAEAGRSKEGIEFYKKLDRNFTKELIRISQFLTEQGKYTKADMALREALKYAKEDENKIKIYINQLVLYDKYEVRSIKHLNAAKKLYAFHQKEKLDEEYYEKLKYQVAKKAAQLQKQVISKTYRRLPKIRKSKSNMAIQYFDIKVKLGSKKPEEDIYYQGETSFAIGYYSNAIAFYDKAYDLSKKNKNYKFQKLSLESLLATLSKKTLNNKVKEKYYVPVYLKYLSTDQKSPRAKSIYQKLFNVYYERNKITDAENVLNSYARNFPKDYKIQEAMLAKIVDFHHKKKNYVKIKSLVKRVNSKQYLISQKFAKKLREILTSIQMEKVQKSLESGDKKAALVGYHKILKDPDATLRAITNAKYNLAVLYYELGNTKKSYLWSVEAIKSMDNKNVQKFSDTFLSISNYLFGRLQFSASADLSMRSMAKMCKTKSRLKNIAFKNSVYVYIANDEFENAVKTIQLAKNCKAYSKYITEAEFSLLDAYRIKGMWIKYEALAKSLARYKANWGRSIKTYDYLEKQYLLKGNSKKSSEFRWAKLNFYNKIKRTKVDIPVASLDVIAESKLIQLRNQALKINNVRLAFPEKTFNYRLKSKLTQLTQLTVNAGNLQKIGSGSGIVKSYKIVIDEYNKFATEIKNFSPPGKSKDYIKSFQGAMRDVYQPLFLKANNFKNEAIKTITTNNILSDDTDSIYSLDKEVQYWYPPKAVIMERGGK